MGYLFPGLSDADDRLFGTVGFGQHPSTFPEQNSTLPRFQIAMEME